MGIRLVITAIQQEQSCANLVPVALSRNGTHFTTRPRIGIRTRPRGIQLELIRIRARAPYLWIEGIEIGRMAHPRCLQAGQLTGTIPMKILSKMPMTELFRRRHGLHGLLVPLQQHIKLEQLDFHGPNAL